VSIIRLTEHTTSETRTLSSLFNQIKPSNMKHNQKG
jgi:hypothetical protein